MYYAKNLIYIFFHSEILLFIMFDYNLYQDLL